MRAMFFTIGPFEMLIIGAVIGVPLACAAFTIIYLSSRGGRGGPGPK